MHVLTQRTSLWAMFTLLSEGHLCPGLSKSLPTKEPPLQTQRPRVNSNGSASEKEVINDPGQIPGSQAGSVGFEGRWLLLSAHTPQWLHLARQELVSRSSLRLPADLLAPLCSPLLPPLLPSPAEQCWGVCPHPPFWLLSWATAGCSSAGSSPGLGLAHNSVLGCGE